MIVRHFQITPHSAQEISATSRRVRRQCAFERAVGIAADVIFYSACVLTAAGCVLLVVHGL